MAQQFLPPLREVFDLSPDPRVRIFRRALPGFEATDDTPAMEVDAYVVLGTSHAVFLDTLICPADMEFVMQALQPDLGQRLLLCVNSHADWDHVWGNCYFQQAPHPLPILAHEACRSRLLSSDAQLKLNGYKKDFALFERVTLAAPTITFREQLTLADETLPVELLAAPGHCRDHLVAWLPSISLLLAFDTLELPLPCIEEEDGAPWLFATLKRLATLQARHILCSHGSSSTDPALLATNLAYLTELERRARLLLIRHRPEPEELAQAALLLEYPFEEIAAASTEPLDHAYYNWAHNENARAILRWLMEASL